MARSLGRAITSQATKTKAKATKPEPFEAGLSTPALLYKIKGFRRQRHKKTPVFEIRVNKARGYHLVKASLFSRKHVRANLAFDCMNVDCMQDFRVVWPPKDSSVAEHGLQVSCPFCGSLYVWPLSFGTDPRDVHLDTEEEWDQVPSGKLRKIKP